MRCCTRTTPARFSQVRVLCLLILLLSGCMGGPVGSGGNTGAEPVPVAPTLMLTPTQPPGEAPGVQPEMPQPAGAIPEQRLLTLEWPPQVREGDSERIYLTLEVDEAGRITPVARSEGHETRGELVDIPNLYETHSVFADARLDLAGVEISPGPEQTEALRPGQPLIFGWNIRPEDVGTYRGTVWLHLRFVPRDPGGQEDRILITAQEIEINAVNLFGLGGTPARLLGGVGALLGSILGLDNVLSWAVGAIKKRKRTD